MTASDRMERDARALLARLDAHMPAEGAHGERVAVYATATAYKMGLRGGLLRILRYAAMLHDLGKLFIDPSSGRAQILLHPELGRQELLRYRGFAQVGELVAAHHERWDGAGYPARLRGEEVPLGARCIAVAEAFDAMAHAVPWRSSIPIDEALGEIKKAAGSQFDPVAVEAFLAVQPLIQPVGSL